MKEILQWAEEHERGEHIKTKEKQKRKFYQLLEKKSQYSLTEPPEIRTVVSNNLPVRNWKSYPSVLTLLCVLNTYL